MLRFAGRKFTWLPFLNPLHLLYLDDSGSAANIAESYFVLGGLSVFEAQADWFTRELDKLAQSIDPANPSLVEFHASEIFARRSEPWKGMGRQEAQGVIKAVLQIVAGSYDTARIFSCAVEKASIRPGTDPVELAFEDLCQRFDLYLTRLRGQGDRQRGLLILDKSTKETSLQRLTREFRSLGTQWGAIHNLADIPFFVDSSASRLVQYADAIAYAVFAGTIRVMHSTSISSPANLIPQMVYCTASHIRWLTMQIACALRVSAGGSEEQPADLNARLTDWPWPSSQHWNGSQGPVC